MNRSNLALALCVLLLVQPLAEARRGGGGGFGRGNSAARSQAGGGGGFQSRPAGAGFNAPQNYPHNNFPQQHNYPQHPAHVGANNRGFSGGAAPHPQQPHFNNQPRFTQGNSMGSPSRASMFGTALAGAAVGTIGGMLAFEAGKAIIKSATTPFQHDGRNYYFDRQNAPNGGQNMCAMPLSQLVNAANSAPTTTTTTLAPPAGNDSNSAVDPNAANAAPANPTQVLQNIQYPDGTRPKEVVWSCPAGQVCCGTDCCPAQMMAAQHPNAAHADLPWTSLTALTAVLVWTLA